MEYFVKLDFSQADMPTQTHLAHLAVRAAIRRGDLIRLITCQTCGKSNQGIIGHHWKGYAFPLDVWWICRGCNRILAHKHDGLLTLEQAAAYVARGRDRDQVLPPPGPGRSIDWDNPFQFSEEEKELFRQTFPDRIAAPKA